MSASDDLRRSGAFEDPHPQRYIAASGTAIWKKLMITFGIKKKVQGSMGKSASPHL